MTITEQIQNQFKNGSMTIKLIMVNVGVFALIFILSLFSKLFLVDINFFGDVLSSSSSLTNLIYKPWSIVTYMFAHTEISHIFWNMIYLYFGGILFERFIGQKKLLSTYILGGLSGLALYILAYNIFPALRLELGRDIIGASAAISAILVAVATHSPNYEVKLFFLPQFGIKLMYIVIGMVVIDFTRLQADIGNPLGNSGGWIAHIGGYLFGYLSIKALQNGRNIFTPFESFLSKITDLFKRKPKMKKVYQSDRPISDKEKRKFADDIKYNENKVEKQKIIDGILDKISKNGYDSLTKKEKDFLFKASKD